MATVEQGALGDLQRIADQLAASRFPTLSMLAAEMNDALVRLTSRLTPEPSDALVKLLWDHAPEIGARPGIHVQGCSCVLRATTERALVDLAGEREHLAHLADVIEASGWRRVE